MDSVKKALLIIAGTIALALGLVGIVVPLLPTTPLLLLSAACYVRSSQTMYNQLMSNAVLGSYIRNYWEHRAITLKSKVGALCLLCAGIGYSTLFVVQLLWVKLLLLAIAIGVSLHILSLRTLATLNSEEVSIKTANEPES